MDWAALAGLLGTHLIDMHTHQVGGFSGRFSQRSGWLGWGSGQYLGDKLFQLGIGGLGGE